MVVAEEQGETIVRAQEQKSCIEGVTAIENLCSSLVLAHRDFPPLY
jgi:hypothetical protein